MFQNSIVTDLAKTGTCLRLKLDLPFLMQFAICQKTLCDGVACLDALMRNAFNFRKSEFYQLYCMKIVQL